MIAIREFMIKYCCKKCREKYGHTKTDHWVFFLEYDPVLHVVYFYLVCAYCRECFGDDAHIQMGVMPIADWEKNVAPKEDDPSPN